MRHLARLVPSAALVAVIVGGGGTVQAGPQAALSAPDRAAPALARIDPYVGPEQPISDLTYSGAAETQENVDVASSGDQYLVVWEDRRSGRPVIYGTRVSAAGEILDPGGMRITEGQSWKSRPTVAWDGSNFLVVWEDDRSSNANDIYGSFVTPSGAVLPEFPISTAPWAQRHPDVAWSGSKYLVVWDYHTVQARSPSTSMARAS